MGDKTGIGWTDATWNPFRGCSKVSAGCKNCYAEKMAARFSGPGKAGFEEDESGQMAAVHPQPYYGLITEGRWNGEVRLVDHMLDKPLRWQKPRMIFVNSMSDMFHESIPFETIAAVFGVMAASPKHTFQCLTKRAARMLEFFEWLKSEAATWDGGNGVSPREVCIQAAMDRTKARSSVRIMLDEPEVWPLPNVWLGVSCEDQEAADERIPALLQCPAAIRWVSYEPALGPINFRDFGLDWIVVGGESQVGARPFYLNWARRTVEQCKAAGVACFVKQMGSKPVLTTYSCTDAGHPLMRTQPFPLNDRAGADPSEWPEDLRVREYPVAS